MGMYPVASEVRLSQPVESKLCELGCGRTFPRPVPLSAKDGQKACEACLKMRGKQRVTQYYQQRELEAKARNGMW
jgi:hypothetical protein